MGLRARMRVERLVLLFNLTVLTLVGLAVWAAVLAAAWAVVVGVMGIAGN
jgi:hypothetical protein